MEKIFQPSKWLVIFCVFLIIIWSCLRYVIVTRILEEAKYRANSTVTWDWKNMNISSKLDKIDKAKIIKQNSNGSDAIVELNGTKIITDEKSNVSTKMPFKLKVYLYNLNNKWLTGAISQE